MVGESTYRQLLRELAEVKRDVSLGQFNGLGAGGRAAYFVTAKDAVEVATAVKAAIDVQLPYEIVGSGTSVLFPDEGYAGLVIHNCSEGFILAADRSQVVVESGLSLQRFITLAAGRGYGGMTQFYGQPGTVGGAVYHNLTIDGSAVSSFIRHLTVLMPPTKMKPYPTVARQRADWLLREDGSTRLRFLREQRSFDQPRPVVLNVQFQLTSVRPDELQRRIQRQASEVHHPPKGAVFGPVFLEPGGDQKLTDILRYSGVQKLADGGVKPDRKDHNYLRAGRTVTAQAVRNCAAAMRARVLERSGIELQYHFEALGVW